MTDRSARRTWSSLAAATLLFLTLAGPATAAGRPGASAPVVSAEAVARSLVRIASGLSSPVLVTNAGDGSGRLFVVEQTGKIRIIAGGSLLAAPFLDLSASISSGGERGLLGLAFHPSYETNGKFYVNFTTKSGDTAINEYRVSADPNVANGASGRRIITIAQPYANHNGGNIAFGPDRYLYVGMGDGGSAGDPGHRAQNLNSLLGKMLRIDINGTSGTRQYRIPPNNPYVGKAGRDEIWSRGLRNPWRWSFDRARGDLWIGDVGQDRYEEIDRSPMSDRATRGRGVNYGWRTMEGRSCYSPASACNKTGKVLPVVVYGHGSGNCSVIGGYVYRGTAARSLVGRYLFADYCSGRIWFIVRGARAPAPRSLFMDTPLNITSFGEGEDGELYITSTDGGVRHIVAP
jgi:glucose/arabinose dehydrogenase